MKIGIVFKPYVSVKEPFRGGMGNFVFLLAKNLTQLGHEVTVLSGTGSKFPPKIKNYNLGYEDKKLNIYKAGDDFYKWVEKNCPSKKDAVDASFGELSARFDRKIETFLNFFSHAHSKKFDILHIVTHDILALYPALFAPMPSVISFHGHYSLLGPDFIRWLKYLKNKKPRQNCTFVSVSKYIQKEYSRFINTKLIYNGIEVKKYKPVFKKKDYIAFLSRIDYHKGLDFAIDFSRQYKIPLLIGGHADDKIYFNRIKHKIDGKLIKYLGPQNEKQKNKLLGEARAVMMSSRYKEAFGRVTAESLACGTPVIAFNKGANPELVINGKTGFIIRENDFAAAKRAWDGISAINPRHCRAFVDNNFDIEKQILKYEALYKKLIK